MDGENNFTGIILIIGRQCTGKTTLIQNIVDRFNLINTTWFDHDNINLFNIYNFYSLNRKTIVLDSGIYNRQYFNDKRDFIYSIRHHNTTLIISFQNKRDIPRYVLNSCRLLFEFPSSGFATANSHLLFSNLHISGSCRIIYRADIDVFLTTLKNVNYGNLLNFNINENEKKEKSKKEIILEIQDIIFDLREHLNENDFLNTMNNLKSLYLE